MINVLAWHVLGSPCGNLEVIIKLIVLVCSPHDFYHDVTSTGEHLPDM